MSHVACRMCDFVCVYICFGLSHFRRAISSEPIENSCSLCVPKRRLRVFWQCCCHTKHTKRNNSEISLVNLRSFLFISSVLHRPLVEPKNFLPEIEFFYLLVFSTWFRRRWHRTKSRWDLHAHQRISEWPAPHDNTSHTSDFCRCVDCCRR